MKNHLFSNYILGPITLDNRIVVSPMCQYMASNGVANDWHLMHYGNMSIGAGSLIIFEATHVSSIGRITNKCLGLYSDECEVALKRVVDFCKNYGSAKLGIQLAHSGRKGSTHPPMNGGTTLTKSESSWETIAPSALPFSNDWHIPRVMKKNDMEQVKHEFVQALIRAIRIGFEVIELHAAHGYLLHQFLSPLSNHREDEYGGSLENRMKFPLEVFKALKESIPDGVALGVRVSGSDWVEGGINQEELIKFVLELEKIGCDFVDVTSGQLDPNQKIKFKPGFNLPFSKKIMDSTNISTMAVGLITNAIQANEIIASGSANLVAIARAAMDDPRWAWHAAKELNVNIEYSPNYKRCHPDIWKS